MYAKYRVFMSDGCIFGIIYFSMDIYFSRVCFVLIHGNMASIVFVQTKLNSVKLYFTLHAQIQRFPIKQVLPH